MITLAKGNEEERIMSTDENFPSVHPLDVGFDLRRHGMKLTPAQAHEGGMVYEKNGERVVVRGDAQEIYDALQAAGYEMTDAWPVKKNGGFCGLQDA